MRCVVDAVDELGPSMAPVLVMGERGTGRELIARILHRSSPRRGEDVVTVHAGVAPKTLFGPGASITSEATLRSARGGTLLIKELTDLPSASQRKLARYLIAHGGGETEHDVRIVGSCDDDLAHAVEAGVFSRELFQLMSGQIIHVPPLRERLADITPLITVFIRQYAREIRKTKRTLSSRAHERLLSYPWPGNVAELKAIARRLVIRAKKSRIEASEVDAVLPSVAERVPLEEMSFEDMVRSKLAGLLRRMDGYPITSLHEDVIRRVEQPMIELVLEHTGGNQLRAAQILGVNRNTLRRKLSEYGMHARTKPAPAKPARSRRPSARVNAHRPGQS